MTEISQCSFMYNMDRMRINTTVPISPVIKAFNSAGGSIEAGFTHARIKWFYITQSPRVTIKTLAAVAGNTINTCCIVETRKCTTLINILFTQLSCKQP